MSEPQEPKPQFAEGQEVYQIWIGELFKVKIIKYLPNSKRYRTQKIDDSIWSIPSITDANNLYFTKTAFYQAKIEVINKGIIASAKKREEYETKIKELGGA